MAVDDTDVCVCGVLRAAGHLPNTALAQLRISPRPKRLFGEVLGFVAVALHLE
jgi:hypothetical protein